MSVCHQINFFSNVFLIEKIVYFYFKTGSLQSGFVCVNSLYFTLQSLNNDLNIMSSLEEFLSRHPQAQFFSRDSIIWAHQPAHMTDLHRTQQMPQYIHWSRSKDHHTAQVSISWCKVHPMVLDNRPRMLMGGLLVFFRHHPQERVHCPRSSRRT